MIAARPRPGAATALLVMSSISFATGAALVGRHLYLEAKAVAAGLLIERAWTGRLAGRGSVRPWPWADVAPIARLEARRLGIDLPILSNASGRTLAFGLGHRPGSAAPGDAGTSVLAGHRDTWAAFLREVRPGEEILIRVPRGARRYRVVETAVVAAGELRVTEGLASAPDRLLFTTCWPFDALRRGPLRYVVIAEAIDARSSIVAARQPR